MGADPWTLEEVTSMDSGFPSLWGFPESVEDLKHKLLCATMELEALRTSTREEMRKNEENTSQLIHLLQVIINERDEAREQVRLLLSKIAPPESPPVRQTRASSSITESDSHSGTPVESFFHAAPPAAGSPELSTARATAGKRQGHELDGLELKMPLPQKGKLLQAVLEAGPLLQTLLLAGPLPQWRNPPPLQQFQALPIAAEAAGKTHDPRLFPQQFMLNSHNSTQCSLRALAHGKSNGEFDLYTPKTTNRLTESMCMMRSCEGSSLKRQKTQ